MSKILLRSLSQEREIVIPDGKTTIGRGPFLTVTDKRVSRSHALLDVSLNTATLTITPVHVNPTFFKSQGNDKFEPLVKGETKRLQNGNIISLLPDKLAFQVVIEDSRDQTNDSVEKETETVFSRENSHQNQETMSSTQSSHIAADGSGGTVVKTSEDENLCRFSQDSIDDAKTVENSVGKKQVQNKTKQCSKTVVQPAAPLQKTRVLPAWMRKGSCGVTQKEKHQTPRGDKEKIILGARKMEPKKTHKVVKEDIEKQEVPGETDDEEDLVRVKKKNIPRSRKRKFYDSDENFVDVEDEKQGKGENTRPSLQMRNQGMKNKAKKDKTLANDIKPEKIERKTLTKIQNISESEEEEDAILEQHETRNDVTLAGEETKEDVVRKSSLPSCPYGKQCYRKNPVHFREYSHPSDNEGGEKGNDLTYNLDSNSEDEAAFDDRPHCQYGISCYRKNPQHRKDFKHTRAPESGRPKRTASDKKKARKSVLDDDEDDLGEENTYDYDDSFLDDESVSSSSASYEEDRDDRDWRPDNDGEDDEDLEEDVNELVAEARGFLRSKKR